MRVAVYHSNSDIRLEERAAPGIGPGELLMRVEASGICGSDVMEWYRIKRAPLVLGHEVSGEVVEVGEGVTAFAPGDRIVTTHHVPCNECRFCRSNRHSVCETLHRTTFDPGGFSELLRLPSINVQRGTFRLPDEVSYEAASFVEPLACTVRAQRIAGVAAGTCVAVLGVGVSGVLQLMLARSSGAGPIVATDVSHWRIAESLRFGADVAVHAGDDVPQSIRDANGGLLADVVIVCTAALPAIEQSFQCVERGGTIMWFAPAPPGASIPFPLNDAWARCINITHSYAGPPADMKRALDLIAGGDVDVASSVTHRLALADTQEGFRLVIEADHSLKVIVEPQR